MRPDARAYLWDVQKACAAIEAFIAGLDANGYAQNEIVHSAVERKFEIIGEALGKLAKQDPQIAGRIPNVREIVAFRNILIHGYAGIEHARVWQIAQTSLPELRESVAMLLQALGPPGR